MMKMAIMKTVGEILRLSASFLSDRGIEHSRRVAEELLAHALKQKRLDLYLAFDRPLEEGELREFRPLLQRAARREPLQYILGEVDFHRVSLAVTSDVLIPRPETEEMVERMIAELEGLDLAGALFVDLCSGSGCIGIAMKKALPQLQVLLADLSPQAMQVARANAARNQVEVLCAIGDLLTPLQGRQVHFLACNPPYVAEKEWIGLAPSVRDFEPYGALVAPEEGRAFYRRLSQEMAPYLHPHARVFLEIGAAQRDVESFFDHPPWCKIRGILDRSGRNRFIFLEKE